MSSTLKDDLKSMSNIQVITTVDKHMMVVNPIDQYISCQMFLYGFWEPHSRDQFKKFVQNGMTVLDIGANIGCHTLLLSELVGEKGKVHAFEPCANNYRLLHTNCVLNRCKNTSVYKLGVSSESKTMFIPSHWADVQTNQNYGCISLKEAKETNDDEQINTITIDSLDLQGVDFVKVDVEGMELHVLKGMINTIRKFRPCMYIEITATNKVSVGELMQELKYKIINIKNDDYLVIPAEKIRIENGQVLFDIKPSAAK